MSMYEALSDLDYREGHLRRPAQAECVCCDDEVDRESTLRCAALGCSKRICCNCQSSQTVNEDVFCPDHWPAIARLRLDELEDERELLHNALVRMAANGDSDAAARVLAGEDAPEPTLEQKLRAMEAASRLGLKPLAMRPQ